MVFPEGTDPSVVASELVGAGVALRKLTPVRRSLEDVYLEVSSRDSGKEAEE